jgi:subtilisin family serine protease
MDSRVRTLARVGLLVVVFLWQASAQDRFLVRAPNSDIGTIAARHNLTLVRSLEGSARNLHLVAAPAGADVQRAIQRLHADAFVQGAELDVSVSLPEKCPGAQLRQMGLPDPAPLSDRTLVKYYGTSAWNAYVNQPAAFVIKVAQGHVFAAGAGTVAFLDTGVDERHRVLAGSLVAGYDFTRKIAGGSEMADIDQSTTSILDQSTTSILDQSTTSILDQKGALILNQSTTSILDQSTTSILDRNRSKLPSAFGHGTMVAGLIHLVAPTAKLMPIKVFSGNGTSTLSNVVNGIYWAVDHGADVISMSFSSTLSSAELRKAIDYANSHGVICVASAGNDGQQNPSVFPAGYHSQVIAVASTNNQNVRSAFSNYGNTLVDVAAPGEGVVTLYPGNNYAEGWGTSFSAPLVAGGAALLVQLGRNHIDGDQADQAISQAIPTGQGLGAGELDLFQACLYELSHGGWR